MSRKRAAANPEVAAPTPIQPPVALPVQREASPEEQAQIQAQVQRQRASVAILKQRFAEVEVDKTIAEAERDQLIQQNQILQQKITALEAEVVALTPKDEEKGSDTEESEEN